MKSFREFIKDTFLLCEDTSSNENENQIYKEAKKKDEESDQIISFGSNIEAVRKDLEPRLRHLIGPEALEKLSPKEQFELLKKYHQDPDSKDAMLIKERIIYANLDLLHKYVNEAYNPIKYPWMTKTDLRSLETKSLAVLNQAIEKFDPSLSNVGSFIPFLTQELYGLLRNGDAGENPARSPSAMGGKQDDQGNFSTEISVDKKVPGGKGDFADKDTTVGDIIPDLNAVMPGRKNEWGRMKLAVVRDAIKQFSDRDQQYCIMYFGLNGEPEKTFDEIGKILNGGKKQAVSQRFKKVLLPTLKQKVIDWAKQEPREDVEANDPELAKILGYI